MAAAAAAFAVAVTLMLPLLRLRFVLIKLCYVLRRAACHGLGFSYFVILALRKNLHDFLFGKQNESFCSIIKVSLQFYK